MKLHREYIRKYKKNTLAILCSMVMTIALVVCLFIVTHSDKNIDSLQGQYVRGAYDIALKDLTREQIKEISNDKRLTHVELEKYLYSGMGDANQKFAIIAANGEYVQERTRILKGRMPVNKNEIVAEVWSLKNLGVKPELNTEFTVKVSDPGSTKEDWKSVTYRVVGIISDNAANKTYGNIEIYTQFQEDYKDASLVLKYKKGIDIKKEGKEIKNQYHLKGKQIHYNYDVVDYAYYQSKASKASLLISFILLCVCAVVISGVYRISLMNRSSQYGILKAVGMQKRQIRALIAKELYEIYFLSIPLGVILGLAVAYSLNMLTRDKTMELIFWGKIYRIQLIIPIEEIALCIVGVGVIVGIIVEITSHMINRKTAIAIIRGELGVNNNKKHVFMTRLFQKMEKPYKAIALKYVCYDVKSIVFVVLSLSIGASLFIGLFYQAKLNHTTNSLQKQMLYYNGDFILEKFNDDLITTGLSEKVLEQIENMKGVRAISTQRALPIRVLDDKKIIKNQNYFDFFDRISKGDFPFDSYEGNDGTDSFYMTELKAYNSTALKNLHKYLLEGDYDPDNMKKDSVILYMPKTIGKNDWRRPQSYPKSGAYVMEYKAGDEITLKYRTDLKTNKNQYYKFTDKDANYTYKKYKIAAIAYYPYMKQVTYMANAYPTIIISEDQMKEIVPKKAYATITLSVDQSLGKKYLNQVNNKLISLVVDNEGATARSIIDQIRDMDNLFRKQLIYSYGIAFVVLVLSCINIINNLKYRIHIRKQEISIYRAIGIRHEMICKMIHLENMILGVISIVVTCIASYPITGYLYHRSQISYLQVGYQNDLFILGVVSILTLIICNVVSRIVTKGLRGSSIVENINTVE
ncbi:ABC transporter permease [Anaeromicropila herbilytica]|uniref:ABC transporter permease n=1 Tax=Anaeromicropila herbilytica TaxID=2785025 RepID=A0A7R7EHG1_9FIRM|nr:ABC transporter permease [Anaeromicropila herbilytica]BCN28916.1 ABC transporter permease [Anaeromicropila herbilytica]